MKEFLIIYEIKERAFVCRISADGIFSALHKFEAEKKVNVDNVLSIDCVTIQGQTQLKEKEETT